MASSLEYSPYFCFCSLIKFQRMRCDWKKKIRKNQQIQWRKSNAKKINGQAYYIAWSNTKFDLFVTIYHGTSDIKYRSKIKTTTKITWNEKHTQQHKMLIRNFCWRLTNRTESPLIHIYPVTSHRTHYQSN